MLSLDCNIQVMIKMITELLLLFATVFSVCVCVCAVVIRSDMLGDLQYC